MQALDVHDAVAAVAGAVCAGGVLDGIEGDADAAVAGGVGVGVGVGLEAQAVEFGDDAGELAEGRARVAAVARTVGVVVEHPGSVRLDHVVGVELDRSEPQALIDRGRVDGFAQIRAEGGIRIHRVEEGGDDTAGELALVAGAEQQVHLGQRNLGLDDRGDAGGAGHPQPGEQHAIAALGRVHREVARPGGEACGDGVSTCTRAP